VCGHVQVDRVFFCRVERRFKGPRRDEDAQAVGVVWGIPVIDPMNLSEHTRKLVAPKVKPMISLNVLRTKVDPDDGARIVWRAIKGRCPPATAGLAGNEGFDDVIRTEGGIRRSRIRSRERAAPTPGMRGTRLGKLEAYLDALCRKPPRGNPLWVKCSRGRVRILTLATHRFSIGVFRWHSLGPTAWLLEPVRLPS